MSPPSLQHDSVPGVCLQQGEREREALIVHGEYRFLYRRERRHCLRHLMVIDTSTFIQLGFKCGVLQTQTTPRLSTFQWRKKTTQKQHSDYVTRPAKTVCVCNSHSERYCSSHTKRLFHPFSYFLSRALKRMILP